MPSYSTFSPPYAMFSTEIISTMSVVVVVVVAFLCFVQVAIKKIDTFFLVIPYRKYVIAH